MKRGEELRKVLVPLIYKNTFLSASPRPHFFLVIIKANQKSIKYTCDLYDEREKNISQHTENIRRFKTKR
jgi:hypothetical protein